MQTWIRANIGALKNRCTILESRTGTNISEPMTIDEYNAIDPKDPNTIYIVIGNDNKLYIFLGNIPMNQTSIDNIVNYGGLVGENVPVPVTMAHATIETE